MNKKNQIKVTSHVSRDFLQNAAYFNTMPKLVWEYVANSLDAAKEDIPIFVTVEITSNYVTISDNGRGMSRSELSNFFQMHGENIQRKRGKRVRGKFGTGKSAAFGLANYLRIDTVQNHLRNVVELSRVDIEQARNGEPFPIKDIVVNQRTDDKDGTVVEIKDFNIKHPNIDNVIRYIERHLSQYRQRVHVDINGHECKFEEPPSIETIEVTPTPDVAKHIGEVSFFIKVSPIPLDNDLKGIDILSHGIWHGTTLAGIENKERANYLFGRIDVPILEDGNWPIPPFDNTRNNTLNPQNPVVAVLLGWISEELEKVRKELVEKEKKRRESEINKKLEKEAKKIARILNDDFTQLEAELELSRRVSKRSGGKNVNEILDTKGELWPGNGDETTSWEETGPMHGDDGKRGNISADGDTPRPGPTARPGNQPGAKKSTQPGNRKRRKAIFSIEYENATEKSPRSRYNSESKTIYINLDHPQVTYAFEADGKRVESRNFREICYEIAAVEYSIVLSHEKAEQSDIYLASDALFDIRDTINRITRKFAKILHL